MPELDRGFIQIYTGNGKGKTTAVLGLTLRAAGAGLSVYFAQFIKGRDCGEIAGLAALGGKVRLERFGSGRWIDRSNPAAYAEELLLGQQGIAAVRDAVNSLQYDIVVMDEILGAVKTGVVPLSEVVDLLRHKPERVELVLTGRNVPTELVELADLVSEITPVKHYYTRGIAARKGIEF